MSNKKILLIAFAVLFFGCRDDERAPTVQPLNSFSMELNERPWQPSVVGEDGCIRTFSCSQTIQTVGSRENRFYTIKAYRDPHARTGPGSENYFKLQISNVKATGTYEISDSYEKNFSSFALFIARKPDGTAHRYINEVNGKSFIVEIEEFVEIEGFSLPGIKGFFHGTLYNEEDPLDSLVFGDGEFTFGKINWSGFNHCP